MYILLLFLLLVVPGQQSNITSPPGGFVNPGYNPGNQVVFPPVQAQTTPPQASAPQGYAQPPPAYAATGTTGMEMGSAPVKK